jgi:hypothetical protein
LKSWVSERFYSNLRREGREINDLSPLSWQFLRFYDLWVVFKGLGVSETKFSFERTQISQFDIMRCSSFLNFVFRKRHVITEILIVFSCLQFADCYIWPRICLVVWFLCFNHCYGIFWKVSLKKSWCCRKHVFVFEIVSLKGLNKFYDQIIFFPVTFWVKDFIRHCGKSLETFPFWALAFFCSRKLNFCILRGWLLSQASRKVLMCSLFLDTS